MNGNEITNHLNAAMVACLRAQTILLPMTEGRYPAIVNDITRQQWQTTLWNAKQAIGKALDHVESASSIIGEPGPERDTDDVDTRMVEVQERYKSDIRAHANEKEAFRRIAADQAAIITDLKEKLSRHEVSA